MLKDRKYYENLEKSIREKESKENKNPINVTECFSQYVGIYASGVCPSPDFLNKLGKVSFGIIDNILDEQMDIITLDKSKPKIKTTEYTERKSGGMVSG